MDQPLKPSGCDPAITVRLHAKHNALVAIRAQFSIIADAQTRIVELMNQHDMFTSSRDQLQEIHEFVTDWQSTIALSLMALTEQQKGKTK